MTKLLITLLLSTPLWAEQKEELPVTNGIFLDLNANYGVELEDGNRVKSWKNQVIGNTADLFVKRDEGRKVPGSGRPTLKKDVTSIGGHHTLVFAEQELINHDEDAFDKMITGNGYTWLSVMSVTKQNLGKKDVNSFFGNLRNGPPYDGFWGNLMDDNRLWMGTRNGLPAPKRPKSKTKAKRKNSTLWDDQLNPLVATRKPLLEDRYYLAMGRMGAGSGTVDLELFLNSTTSSDKKRVPVNPSANSSKMAIGQERDAINHPGFESFHGEITRFLIFERPLTDEELKIMTQYLCATYRIQ